MFAEPWILLSLPLILLPWLPARRSAAGLPEATSTGQRFLRSAVLLLLILAAAGAELPRLARPRVVALLDVSESISPASLEESTAWLQQLEHRFPAQLRTLAFASAAQPVRAAALESLPVRRQASEPVNDALLSRSATDLERALDAATALFDGEGPRHLLLISDGRETRGQALRALPRLERSNIRVFPRVAEGALPATPSRIDGVRFLGEPHAGLAVDAEVEIVSSSHHRAFLRLGERGAAPNGALDLTLEPGRQKVTIETTFDSPGLVEVEATLGAPDSTRTAPSRWLGAVQVKARRRLLHAEGFPDSAHYLRQALEAEGFAVESIDPTTLASGAAAAEAYAPISGLILSDIRATDLRTEQMEAIRSWVRDHGGALFFVSGENTFGEEGYSNTAIEELLPVRFSIEQERSDVSLAVVLDKSYSMRGDNIALAKAATEAALDLLDDEHLFCLVTFDWNPHLVVPIARAEERDAMRQQIQSVQAGAQTNFFPALELANEQLLSTTSEIRHLVLISDGKTYPDEYEHLIRTMQENDITLSTIAIGPEADRKLLADLAEWGSGRSYFLEDASRIEEILLDETQQAKDRSVIEEPVRPQVVGADASLAGLSSERFPPLRGHITTALAPDQQALLATEDGTPLLATWNYGLGKTAFFASDVKNRWARDWIGWPGYGRLWGQLMRSLVGGEEPAQSALRIARHGDRVVLEVEALDAGSHPRHGLAPIVRTGEQSWELPQVGAGLYRREVKLVPQSDPYLFEVELDGETLLQPLYYPTSDETAPSAPDRALLETLAASTGGSLEASEDQLFARTLSPSGNGLELWPLLTSLALGLYLFETAWRRFPHLSSRHRSSSRPSTEETRAA